MHTPASLRPHRPAWPRALAGAALSALIALLPAAAGAQTAGDDLIVQAREALRKGDAVRLAALSSAAAELRHPLTLWVEYWELGNRLDKAQVPELEAFYARWPGSYVEDRLRNDWLLELGKRRDWAAFARDMPRFKMNDDRQVTCYHLLTRHLAGDNVTDAAREAWYAQTRDDDGCDLLARTMYEAGRFKSADVWRRAQQSMQANRPAAARAAAAIIGSDAARDVAALSAGPERFLRGNPGERELALLALLRLATQSPDDAARALESTWQKRLKAEQAAQVWATIGQRAALRLQDDAVPRYQKAWETLRKHSPDAWGDEALAWQVRAALRLPADDPQRWALVLRGIDGMSPAEQEDPAWMYWKARALQASALQGADGDAERAESRHLFGRIAGGMHFYGKLAAEALGRSVPLPPPPKPLTDAERQAAATNPGLVRALQLLGMGLRSEGVREWNFTLIGMSDRELLAAAQLACDNQVWDRCVNTSDRTREEIDLNQRFPMPFREEVLEAARRIGLDPAYVYGLIRQESRFITDARSHVGASGLMQVMPATARWTARKIGMDFKPSMLNDRDTNLRLGTAYLKLAIDDFGGSQAMAAAAYNAGPNRPRRWRLGGVYEAAAWAESIPFNETRDYVKKVLSNATYYAALIEGRVTSLQQRLGGPIGPRPSSEPAEDKEIP